QAHLRLVLEVPGGRVAGLAVNRHADRGIWIAEVDYEPDAGPRSRAVAGAWNVSGVVDSVAIAADPPPTGGEDVPDGFVVALVHVGAGTLEEPAALLWHQKLMSHQDLVDRTPAPGLRLGTKLGGQLGDRQIERLPKDLIPRLDAVPTEPRRSRV